MKLKVSLFLSLLVVSQSVFAFDLTSLKGKIQKPSDLNHIETFGRIADDLVEQGFVPKEKAKLSFLYPGAGSHVAVLRLSQRIVEVRSAVKEVTVFLTDIDDEASKRFQGYLKILAEAPRGQGIADLKLGNRSFEQGSEISLSFKDPQSGVDYRVVYALNRSDEKADSDPDTGRIFYYRQSYFDESDVIIHHDSSMDRYTSTFVADFMTSYARYSLAHPKGSDKAFVMEDMNSAWNLSEGDRWVNYSLLPGKISVVPGDFGCRHDDRDIEIEDNHLGTPKFTRAAVFYPNREFWSRLTPMQGKSLTLLAHTNAYPDTGPFLTDGLSHILLNNAPDLLVPIKASLRELRGSLAGLGVSKETLTEFERHYATEFLSNYPDSSASVETPESPESAEVSEASIVIAPQDVQGDAVHF